MPVRSLGYLRLEEIHTPLFEVPFSNSAAFGGFLAMEPH
jgi:hypothetical protein